MSLIISGVIDGPLSGGVPKAIELYVTADIADLSIYGLESANNGGGAAGAEFTFPAVSATAGTYIYVASETTGFTNYFGSAPDYTGGVASINGDDAILLYENGTVIDVFGDPDTDGTGEAWDYVDGWAYRNNGTGPSATFDPAEWTISGPDALDGETDNGSAATPMPAGSYAQFADELLISEIIEGSSFNKAVEIYNGTGASVDLSAYSLEIYFNGSTSAGTTIALSGTLAHGEVYVVADNDADAAILAVADQTSTASFFNGDDAIVLAKGSAVIDSFGQIGTDPGSEWPGGGQNDTLIRKAAVTDGDTDPTDAFDASDEWEVRATDDFSDLGQHGPGGGTGGTPTLTLTLDATAMSENGGSATGTLTRTGDASAELTVTLTSSDTTEASVPATATFAAGSDTATFTVTAVDDGIADGTQSVTISASDGGLLNANASIDVTDDEVTITKIHDIQGTAGTANGDVVGTDDIAAMNGQTVTIEAIVTADFQDGAFGHLGDLNGFYVQEEVTDYDFNDLTSEGIFIYDGFSPSVDVMTGDLVRITGTVSEFGGTTQINPTSIQVVSSANLLPDAVDIVFPVASVQVSSGGYIANLEAYEGMLVNIPQAMITTEMFNLDRFGEYRISTERFEQFTQSNDPDTAGYEQHRQDVARSSIVLDDGLTIQNPSQVKVIDGNNGILETTDTFSMGDTLTDTTGVVSHLFNQFRILNGTGTYADTNPRQESPEEVGGNFKVASLNVLNYFTTIDTSGATTDLGHDPRGADTPEELERQANKIVQGILAIDADILGLVEIENDFAGTDFAIKDLVARLNAELGADLYAFVDPGQEFVGGDAIANALIYRQDRVDVVGEMAILEEFNGQDFIDPLDAGRPLNRAAIAQTFVDLGSGQTLTVSVNHLKSKGSLSGLAADDDQLDGAGNNNATREAAAEILADWLASDPTGQGATKTLILGDLNSYAREDPITLLEGEGYTDLGRASNPEAYSYVFDGQIGTLDYAMANEALLADFTGATEWHINADEADAFDYDTTFNDPSFYDADTPARYSDHDPVIAGFNFYNDVTAEVRPNFYRGTSLNDRIIGTADNEKLRGLAGNDLVSGGEGNDRVFGYAGNDILMDGAGRDIVLGGDGEDTLIWQGGTRDVYVGGADADTFQFADTITSNGVRDRLIVRDYEVGVDIVDLGGALIDRVRETGNRTMLVLDGDGDVVIFNGVSSVADLTFTDVPFVV
jgi:predicted extracellular nuclease